MERFKFEEKNSKKHAKSKNRVYTVNIGCTNIHNHI
jgi:hypothetical protein